MAIVLDQLQNALGNRYDVRGELGRGGMAVVFEAWDNERDGPVALKVLHPELAQTVGGERFLRETKIAQRLGHPHIVPVYDSGTAGPYVYYTMQKASGESLQDRLDREGQLPVPQALEITRQVASALEYAHAQGVVHRDIKPGNILLTEGGAVVTDFGIARAVDDAGERLTETGLAMGTPAYMAPEQAEEGRRLDGRADQYSLACVLYQMLAGESPFTGANAQIILNKHAKDPVPPLGTARSTVTGPIEAVVAKALAKTPADRFTSAQKFSEALDIAEQGVTPRDVTPYTGTQPYPQGIWGELARRRVYQVAASYVVVAFGLIEIVDTLGPNLGIPDAFGRWLQWSAVAGFPVMLLLTWAFQLTPSGLKRTQALGVTPSTGVHSLRPWHRIAMTLAVVFVGTTGLLLSMGTDRGGDGALAALSELDPLRLLVVPFENQTADPSLDYVGQDIATAVIADAHRIEGVTAISGRGALTEASLGAAAGNRAGTILMGRVTRAGEEIRVTAEIIDARDGAALKSIGPISGSPDDPVSLVGEAASRSLSGIALELTIDAVNEPSDPPLFDALRAYMDGLDVLEATFAVERALELFEESIALDTGFVEAAWQIEGALEQLERPDEAAHWRVWLNDRRTRMSEVLIAVDDYWVRGFGNRDGEVAWALATEMRRKTQSATRPEGAFYEQLAAQALARNRFEEAVRVIDGAGELPAPRAFFTWSIMRKALHLSGDYAREYEIAVAAREAMRNQALEAFALTQLARPLVAQGRLDETLAVLDEIADLVVGVYPPPCTYGEVGRQALAHGHAALADSLLGEAARWFDATPASVVRQVGDDSWCKAMGSADGFRAIALYEAGRHEEALAVFLGEALEAPNVNQRVIFETYAARAAAYLGDSTTLSRMLDALGGVPETDRYQHYYYGLAAVAELSGDRSGAIEYLREAERTGEAINKGDFSLAYIVHTDPDFHDLRTDETVIDLFGLR